MQDDDEVENASSENYSRVDERVDGTYIEHLNARGALPVDLLPRERDSLV